MTAVSVCCIPRVRLRVPSTKTSSASPRNSRSCATSIDWRAARATSRTFITASSLETALLCGVLIVPKQRLENRRFRLE